MTIFIFLLGTTGLVLMSTGGSLVMAVPGAMLVVGSAIVFARHFWREGDRKRKQDLMAYERTLSAQIAQATQTANLSREEIREDVTRRVDVFTQGVLEYMAQLELDVSESEQSSSKRFESLARGVSRSRDDVLTQVGGIIGVYSVLNPSTPYLAFGGWAIGGDCAQRLVSLILSKRPRYVLEVGSGLSTVLTAQALELLGGEGQVISFEHESQWLERSQAMVADHQMSHRSQILYTPLVETPIGGETFLWYDLSEVDLPEEVQLIFIDGPPKATGPLARYPAVPILLEHLRVGGVILMDDAGRPDERAAIERWGEEFPELTFRFHKDSNGTAEIIKGKG